MELLDAVAPRREMELIHDLAYPLPVTVIAELLGIPNADRSRIQRVVRHARHPSRPAAGQ
jgi:cytochrome P450